MRCSICENRCVIGPGGVGRCRMYTNEGGTIVERYPDRYIAVMPIAIETMPMCHYYPRETFLQASGIKAMRIGMRIISRRDKGHPLGE